MGNKYTFGEKCADKIASYGGSWSFVFTSILFLLSWMLFNTYFKSFDPPPFIGLNLILSCVAAFQAPFILMSANRQAQLDRKRDEKDFALDKDTNKKINEILEILKNK
jgi:uncharacterized membrane protein